MRPSSLFLALLLASTTPSSQGQTFTGTGGPIPDDGTVIEFPLTVSGLVPGNIDTTFFGLEEVCIDLEHTRIADLDIFVIAPDGTIALLTSDNGGNTDYYTNTCFRSDATTYILYGSSPYTGTFGPISQMGVMNNGQNANGIWKLRIYDADPFVNTGALFTWSVSFGNTPGQYSVLHSSNLPIVVINTGGFVIPNEPEIHSEMGIIDNPPGVRNYMTDPFNGYLGDISIETRGNSSLMFPKKQYGLELQDSLGNDLEVSILGMPPESDWAMRASFSDKSLLNDAITMHCSEGMGHYAPRWRHVEVVIDGQYLGVYIFIEKIKRDADRVDIAKLLPADTTGDELTGGYIVKIDHSQGAFTGGWTSPYPPLENSGGQTINFYYDYPDQPQPAQADYIAAYIDSFETALAGPDFDDPINGYKPFIDLRSFVDHFLVNELSRNVDAYRLSTFLHKDKNSNGGALRIGPLWDFDLAWANANWCRGNDTTGWAWQYGTDCPADPRQVPFWWERFLQDDDFVDSLRCRWDELKYGLLGINALHAWCDSMASWLDESQARNFERWPNLGVYVWPNPSPIPATYAGEILELKNWISARWAWMDSNLPDNVNGCLQVSVAEAGDATSPKVFPNPFSDRISVILQGSGDWQLELIDALGRVVHHDVLRVASTDARRFEVTMPPSLAPGTYALRLWNIEGSFTVPVMKE